MSALELAPPPEPAEAGRSLEFGRWAGALDYDVAAVGDRRGRLRRWSYVAAADAQIAAGAAIVDLGYVVASFLWICREGQVLQWERKGVPRVHGRVPPRIDGPPAWFRQGRHRVQIGDGVVRAEVGPPSQRLSLHLDLVPDAPATVVVGTPHGGWNATQKVAGERATGSVSAPGWTGSLAGGGWRDFTVGRQDRHTTWRWAAAAGRTPTGRVGINVGTGMNGQPPGENVVWWDGMPRGLEVTVLEPVAAFEGAWKLAGPGWQLDFRPDGVRAADENLLLVRSRYVQPIGTFTGTLPGPDGTPVPVELRGVTEDHEARW